MKKPDGLVGSKDLEWVERRTWEEFRKTKLLWWINRTLHLFGWSIVVQFKEDSEEIDFAYPARVKYRGYIESIEIEGFIGLSQYLKDNIDEIEKDTYL